MSTSGATSRVRLPVIGGGAKMRRSRRGPWRAAVLVGVHLLIVLHIAHWRLTGRTLSPLEPSEAMELGKHGVVNAGLVFFAATILVTAVLGRFFCGWGCHLVALQDASRWLLARLGIRPLALDSRLLRLVPLFAFAYMFLWPAAYRLATGQGVERFELRLTTTTFWSIFPTWAVALMTFAVCGFVAVYLLGAKGFCTYGCPYGAIFGVADRLAPGRIRVTDACEGCGHCTATCTSNVRVHEEVRDYGMVVDPGCMKCMDCVSVCPKDALYFGFGKPALGAAPRPAAAPRPRRGLPWSEELVLAGAFVLAFAVFRGLYDAVPFLFALGLGGVLAYLALVLWRLGRRPHVRLRRAQLRKDGRLRPAGYAFLALMATLGALFLHSAWIQLHAQRGALAYRATAALRARALEPRPASPSAAEREALARAVEHLGRAADGGLLAQPRLDLELAWLHLAAGEEEAFAERIAVAREALPGNGLVHLLLGRHHAAAGRFDDAVAAYREAIASEPPMANAYLGLGTLWAGRGELARAREVFTAGLGRLPESAALYFNVGVVDALSADTEAAIESFEIALSLDPGHRGARENLAGMLASSGRYRESLEHYRRAIRQDPRDATTHLLAARVLIALEARDEAEQALDRALALDPGLEEARGLREGLRRRAPER